MFAATVCVLDSEQEEKEERCDGGGVAHSQLLDALAARPTLNWLPARAPRGSVALQ